MDGVLAAAHPVQFGQELLSVTIAAGTTGKNCVAPSVIRIEGTSRDSSSF